MMSSTAHLEHQKPEADTRGLPEAFKQLLIEIITRSGSFRQQLGHLAVVLADPDHLALSTSSSRHQEQQSRRIRHAADAPEMNMKLYNKNFCIYFHQDEPTSG